MHLTCFAVKIKLTLFLQLRKHVLLRNPSKYKKREKNLNMETNFLCELRFIAILIENETQFQKREEILKLFFFNYWADWRRNKEIKKNELEFFLFFHLSLRLYSKCS